MVSITVYNYIGDITPPTDCTMNGKSENATINFKDLPYNYILCNLLRILPSSASLPQIKLVQAAPKYFEGNRATNAVFTVQNGGTYEEGQSVMVDLNLFAVYTVEGQLADDKEHLLAYETKNFGTTTQIDGLLNTTLANDNIGCILDSTIIDDQTVEILVSMASAKARWSKSDFSDFVKVSANVTDAVETSLRWIIIVSALAVLFLLPQVIRLIIAVFLIIHKILELSLIHHWKMFVVWSHEKVNLKQDVSL